MTKCGPPCKKLTPLQGAAHLEFLKVGTPGGHRSDLDAFAVAKEKNGSPPLKSTGEAGKCHRHPKVMAALDYHRLQDEQQLMKAGERGWTKARLTKHLIDLIDRTPEGVPSHRCPGPRLPQTDPQAAGEYCQPD